DVRLDVIEGLRRIARVQAAPGDPSLSNTKLARSNLDRAEALARNLPETGADRGKRAVILSRIALARATLSSFVDSDFAAATRSLDESRARLAEALQADPASPDALAL